MGREFTKRGRLTSSCNHANAIDIVVRVKVEVSRGGATTVGTTTLVADELLGRCVGAGQVGDAELGEGSLPASLSGELGSDLMFVRFAAEVDVESALARTSSTFDSRQGQRRAGGVEAHQSSLKISAMSSSSSRPCLQPFTSCSRRGAVSHQWSSPRTARSELTPCC